MPDAPTTHPTPQELAEYGLGKLPAGRLAWVRAHLAGCPECLRQVGARPPDSSARRLPPPAPGADSTPPTVPHRPSESAMAAARLLGAPPGDAPAELAGSSKYRILGKLGQGGMGAVDKAVQ